MSATALWSLFDVLALSACIRWRTSSAAVTEALITAVTKENLTIIHQLFTFVLYYCSQSKQEDYELQIHIRSYLHV